MFIGNFRSNSFLKLVQKSNFLQYLSVCKAYHMSDSSESMEVTRYTSKLFVENYSLNKGFNIYYKYFTNDLVSFGSMYI